MVQPSDGEHVDTVQRRFTQRWLFRVCALGLLVALVGVLVFVTAEVDAANEEVCARLDCICETTTYVKVWSSTTCFNLDGDRVEFLEFEL